jgi:hypothetical protein
MAAVAEARDKLQRFQLSAKQRRRRYRVPSGSESGRRANRMPTLFLSPLRERWRFGADFSTAARRVPGG